MAGCIAGAAPAPLTLLPLRTALLPMKITYYLEVLSSWCTWVEPVWAELKQRYAGRAEFQWKIALMKPEDFPVSREQCDGLIVTENYHCMIQADLLPLAA